MQMPCIQSLDPVITVKKNSTEKRCYTVDDLMSILCVGRKAIYSLIHRKAFPAIRIGSIGYRIPRESFDAWMNQSQND